jgi:hypothetical protein
MSSVTSVEGNLWPSSLDSSQSTNYSLVPVSDPKHSSLSTSDNLEQLLASWREYVAELGGGERTEKVVMITRVTDASSLQQNNATELEEDKYPVRITVEYFSKWITKERLSAVSTCAISLFIDANSHVLIRLL